MTRRDTHLFSVTKANNRVFAHNLALREWLDRTLVSVCILNDISSKLQENIRTILFETSKTTFD
jgi:hypothetical protein